jgi:heme exporter protein C
MKPLKLLFALAIAGATAATFVAPDAKNFAEPRLARMIFFHLPCAIIAALFLIAGAFYGFNYLRSRDWQWEVKSVAANEMGFLLGILTMLTGLLFSRVQWLAWWNWDPRQTTFLLVLFLFGGYFALRSAFPDERKRAANSAAYSVAMLLPTLFLIFVAPRVMNAVSLHPNETIMSGGFDATYRSVLIGLGVLIFALSVWIFRVRVRAGLAEHALENEYGDLDDRGGAAAVSVGRPVSLSAED